MKTRSTINAHIQETLESVAINAMITYTHHEISQAQLNEKLQAALAYYGSTGGHAQIALKGWIIRAMHALNEQEIAQLDRMIADYEKAE